MKEKKRHVRGEKKETQRETNEGGERGLSSSMKDRPKMDERKRGMMRGEMRGDSDEQAITMIDGAEETSARDGGSRRMSGNKMSEGRRGRRAGERRREQGDD